MDAATAGTVLSETHAAINPTAHGQTNSYDLGIDLGLGHVTTDNNIIRYNISDNEYFH